MMQFSLAKDEWAIIHFVSGLIAIPLILDEVVKLLTHYGNIESCKY
jgi:hypothetical protein